MSTVSALHNMCVSVTQDGGEETAQNVRIYDSILRVHSLHSTGYTEESPNKGNFGTVVLSFVLFGRSKLHGTIGRKIILGPQAVSFAERLSIFQSVHVLYIGDFTVYTHRIYTVRSPIMDTQTYGQPSTKDTVPDLR